MSYHLYWCPRYAEWPQLVSRNPRAGFGTPARPQWLFPRHIVGAHTSNSLVGAPAQKALRQWKFPPQHLYVPSSVDTFINTHRTQNTVPLYRWPFKIIDKQIGLLPRDKQCTRWPLCSVSLPPLTDARRQRSCFVSSPRSTIRLSARIVGRQSCCVSERQQTRYGRGGSAENKTNSWLWQRVDNSRCGYDLEWPPAECGQTEWVEYMDLHFHTRWYPCRVLTTPPHIVRDVLVQIPVSGLISGVKYWTSACINIYVWLGLF